MQVELRVGTNDDQSRRGSEGVCRQHRPAIPWMVSIRRIRRETLETRGRRGHSDIVNSSHSATEQLIVSIAPCTWDVSQKSQEPWPGFFLLPDDKKAGSINVSMLEIGSCKAGTFVLRGVSPGPLMTFELRPVKLRAVQKWRRYRIVSR